MKVVLHFLGCGLALAAPHSDSCEARCAVAGHCCVGTESSYQHPSCANGCIIASHVVDEAACNSTCAEADKAGCDYQVASGPTLNMCTSCPDRYLPPGNVDTPWWPSGYRLPSCNGNGQDECLLGCRLAFNSDLVPDPPAKPEWPPSPPKPRAPKDQRSLGFHSALSSHIVLQSSPAAAAVYGWLGDVSSNDIKVEVKVTDATAGDSYSLDAEVDTQAGSWKALLRPTEAHSSATIEARCVSGCSGSAKIDDVVFGDVWYCGGQSNMWLPMKFTYHRKQSFDSIKAGKYDNIRLSAGDSQKVKENDGKQFPWLRAQDAISGSEPPLDEFSATCWYFAEALTDMLEGMPALGKVPPIGLVASAIGGSMIEEWVTIDVAKQCNLADVADHNGMLWNQNILPFADMTVKGWLFYQGENNCGTLHGNSATGTGYGCLMPKMLDLWRKEWSKVPGTTNPMAPFGVVSLSAYDSEGASDMASFRWSQTANYGMLPNEFMPNSFLAHGYDLADPWNSDTCDHIDPLYECDTPYYMGPNIHPRLKYPVGQRLAIGAMRMAYGSRDHYAQATISGCSVSAGQLMVSFNSTLLDGHELVVQKYDTSDPERSGFSVLTAGGEWTPVNIVTGSGATVHVDLSPLSGAVPVAIKYAWGAARNPVGDDVSCCGSQPFGTDNTKECLPASCPLMVGNKVGVPGAMYGGLPANPFLAQVIDNKCVCQAPQVCSGEAAIV